MRFSSLAEKAAINLVKTAGCLGKNLAWMSNRYCLKSEKATHALEGSHEYSNHTHTSTEQFQVNAS